MPRFDADRLRASVCRESLFEFVREFWDEVNPGTTPIWNWHIPYICGLFQETAERVFRNEHKTHDLLVNVPPGSTKSTIFSIMGPAWVWTRMPGCRIIAASYSQDLAWDLAMKSRNIIESDKYRRCFPDVVLSSSQNTKSYFVTTKTGFRLSVGVGTMVTGRHAHIQIVDDPLDPLAAASDETVKAVNNWFTGTLFSRKVSIPLTPLFCIHQRLHQNDPTGYLLDTVPEMVKHVCLPAELSDIVAPAGLRRHYYDGLLDPVRFTAETLLQSRRSMGERAYSAQYRQFPVPPGGGMFHVEKFRPINGMVDMSEFARIVRYWDKAATFDDGAYTVGIKMGRRRDGSFHVFHRIRGQWDASRRERIIRDTAVMDGPRVRVGVEQEPGGAGKESAEATARNLAGFRVVLDRVSGAKEDRADPFSTQVNSGNVTIAEEVFDHDFKEEFRFFPFSTYKDQVDAASGAFNMLARAPVRVGGL